MERFKKIFNLDYKLAIQWKYSVLFCFFLLKRSIIGSHLMPLYTLLSTLSVFYLFDVVDVCLFCLSNKNLSSEN